MKREPSAELVWQLLPDHVICESTELGIEISMASAEKELASTGSCVRMGNSPINIPCWHLLRE